MAKNPAMTDFVLLQLALPADTVQDTALIKLVDRFKDFCVQSPLSLSVHRVSFSAATRTAYAYARLAKPALLEAQALEPYIEWWGRNADGWENVRLSRLEKVFEEAGRSWAEQPVFHYIVEMDPDAGWMPEIARWYDEEHMPGLAAVEGCILAMRCINHDHGPYSLACYDLVSDQTLQRPAWLAVRGSAWSDITRPHFCNTLRTMMVVQA